MHIFATLDRVVVSRIGGGLALAAMYLACASVLAFSPMTQGATVPTTLPPLVVGDEPIIVTQHRIQTTNGPLDYEARVGRLPIRNDENGELRGRLFFTAYIVKAKGPRRPLTFVWNGGPTQPSNLLHLELMGPRRRVADHLVDNPETLLAQTDLVFYDPIETGFSRPEKPEFAAEFLNMKGDVAATVEFIRAYRTRFRAADQPLFVAGESYGVFRAAYVTDVLTQQGVKLVGSILISGDIPNIPQPLAFYNAMHIQARTVVAYYFHKLSPELMRDRTATLKEANDWATSVYMPALQNLDTLGDTDREKIAQDLARYIGMRADQVDRRTLVVTNKHFNEDLFDGDKTKQLVKTDSRVLTTDNRDRGLPTVTDSYFRDELGYATDLTYLPSESGYLGTPGPGGRRRSTYDQWTYNQDGITPEIMARTRDEGEVTYIAMNNPTWIPNALKRDKRLAVFVATGRFDSMNMCEGNVLATATLPVDLASRISNHCYEGGHQMYRDEPARLLMSRELSEFIRGAALARSAGS
jgi:carboxypeptidase C (cathepsin A)